MPEYSYRAVTSKGQIVTNRVEDTSRNSLIKKLKNNDLLPISITQSSLRGKKSKSSKRNIMDIDDIMKQANSSNVFRGKAQKTMTMQEKINIKLAADEKVSNRDVIIFTQNLYLLKKANFNNLHALSTIVDSTENLSLKGIIQDILAGVEAGEYMYTTMEYYSDVFPYIYINMIKVGEKSGALVKSLEQAVKYLENSSKTSRSLKSILIPSLIQLVAILLILIASVVYIIPMIEGYFEELGSPDKMPAITVWFVDFCNAIGDYWVVPTVIIAGIIAIIITYVHTPKGKYNYDYFKYTMPVFGKLVYAMDFSRLVKALLLNLENGMRIAEALEVSKSVVKNYVLLSVIEASINNILIGASWIEPFEKSGLCSSMQIEMLKIGMQTDLTQMMEKLVDYMEIDIENITQKVMAILPQITYSIVGIALIFLVLVVVVPCIQLYMGDGLLESALGY